MKPGRRDRGHIRRDTDLIDDRQIQGKWIVYFHQCAKPTLREPRLTNLIKFVTRSSPNKDEQPAAHFEIHYASEVTDVMYSSEGAFLEIGKHAWMEELDVASGLAEHKESSIR